jgi:hypothetical protein
MLPDAFAFFLPAFMRIALNDFETSDAIPDSVIFDLLGLAEGRNQDRLRYFLHILPSSCSLFQYF